MRKKLIALSVALLTIGGSLTFTTAANAAGTEFCNGADGSNGEMTIEANVLTDGSACTGDVVIPNGVDGIRYGAFVANESIVSVDFSKDHALSFIGDRAFAGTQITVLDLSSNGLLVLIGEGAFASTPITVLDLSRNTNLEVIGQHAFEYSSLQSINLSGATSLRSIDNNAFYGTPILTSVDFTGATALTTIGDEAFGSAFSLSSIDLLSNTSLTSIGDDAFAGDSLNTVKLPSGLTHLGMNAFQLSENQSVSCLIYLGNNDDVLHELMEEYISVNQCTPAITIPPDFLTPKTYGNPASVTGTAPAAPAVALTPTAPVISAGSTSVIYNGVPQSAPYSVDQKSSCSTTYNGSAIPPVAAGSYAVSITCSANSLTSTVTTTLTITKAAPVISWSTPGAITTATKLSSSQLNAFSYIPGSFTYSASTVSTLPAGDDLVTATFTPTDTTNYTSATMTVTIKVTA